MFITLVVKLPHLLCDEFVHGYPHWLQTAFIQCGLKFIYLTVPAEFLR